MKVASFRILFFLVVLSGIIAIKAFFFPGNKENASASQFSYELFISQAGQDKNLDKFVGENIQSFSRIPGNSINAYKPHQSFLLKLKFNHPLDDDLTLHIRPISTSIGAKIYSKDLVLLDSLPNPSTGVQLNTSVSELKFRQVGHSKSPEMYIEINNRVSEVVTIDAQTNGNIYGDWLFTSGLYLGAAIFCGLLPLFFYFQYKQKIFLLLDAFIISLILKFLFTNALISWDFFEIYGVNSHAGIVSGLFYLINLLQSLFIIYFVKLIINNKYVYIASIINTFIYLIYILSSNSLLDIFLLNTFYIVSYLLILSIFIIYTQNLKINRFMYFTGYGIQFFALYLLAIKYHFIDSPIDYSYYYFSILPLGYFIFFMYVLVHHYNLILFDQIYEQNQSNIKATHQLELSKTVSNSQVLLLEAISHELKSPLMALYFLIDSISPSGEGLNRVIQRIKSTLNQISYIVERFTSLSKFYSINELVIRKNIDIYTLITSLLEVRPEHKGIILNSNSENMVESDYVLLQLIFRNLIENAIKYRMDSESSITININRFTENILRIDISNSLDKNITVNLEKIFDMYYRGANIKNEPGMGVGLWITREIVKKIKGEINVSRDGDRIIFSVYIPISFSI